MPCLSGQIRETKKGHQLVSFLFGGDDRDRTDYLLNAIQALSQVSYTPTGLHESSALL